MRPTTTRVHHHCNGAVRRGRAAAHSAHRPSQCSLQVRQERPSWVAPVVHGFRFATEQRGPAPCAATSSDVGKKQTIAITGASAFGRASRVHGRASRHRHSTNLRSSGSSTALPAAQHTQHHHHAPAVLQHSQGCNQSALVMPRRAVHPLLSLTSSGPQAAARPGSSRR